MAPKPASATTFRAAASIAFGHAHILAGKWKEAADALAEALEIARAGRANVEIEPSALTWLAAAHVGLGDLTRARIGTEEAIEVAQRRSTQLAECIAHIGYARVLLRGNAAKERDLISSSLHNALTLIGKTGAYSNAPFVHIELARLAAALGDKRARRAELSTAHRLFSDMGASVRAERIAREL